MVKVTWQVSSCKHSKSKSQSCEPVLLVLWKSSTYLTHPPILSLILSSSSPLLPILSSLARTKHHSPNTKLRYDTIDDRSPLLKPWTRAVISLAWHVLVCQGKLSGSAIERTHRVTALCCQWWVARKQCGVSFGFSNISHRFGYYCLFVCLISFL